MAKIKTTLNPQYITGIKPAPQGQRIDHWDSVVPGLSVRVSHSGSKTFTLVAPLPGAGRNHRYTIDSVGAITLVQAREKAREWLELISTGKDPRTIEIAKAQTLTQEVAANEAGLFRNVVAKFLTVKQPQLKQKNFDYMKRGFDVYWLPAFGARPIASITALEIGDVIAKVAPGKRGKGGGKGAARILLANVKTMFAWAGRTGHANGSVAMLLQADDYVGSKKRAARTLTDDELKAVWRVAGELSYPLGPIYRLLILTGCRLNEVVQANWSEIDLRAKLWTIPAKRMKQGKMHIVPLTAMMLDLLRGLPRGTEGDYLFSKNDGKTAIRFYSCDKDRMDYHLSFTDWVNHDLRRTVRTKCSKIKIAPHVAEAMIAHAQPGIIGIYNHDDFLDEKRDGFTRWNDHLAKLVEAKSAVKPLRLVA